MYRGTEIPASNLIIKGMKNDHYIEHIENDDKTYNHALTKNSNIWKTIKTYLL